MESKTKIHPAAIDLLARVFNSHKKGLPEWMKNAREAYLRKRVDSRDKRVIILDYHESKVPERTWLECVDFVGISGTDIENKYIEWANPEVAVEGLKPGEAEGGQGNGGKAYLRQMFDKGYFISIYEGKLSIVSFTDPKKYVLDFVPDEKNGKDFEGDSVVLPGIRSSAASWIEAYELPAGHNITIVRGIGPTKPIDPDRLLEEIQQSPQARQTIRACCVLFCINGAFKRELAVAEPALHPAFPKPIRTPIPLTLPLDSVEVQTSRPPDFPPGEIELFISTRPLQGQALGSWNRIEFQGKGLSVIGWKGVEELPLEFPHLGRHLFGRCKLPLLVDPRDNYELQGRVHLNEGLLSDALYAFITAEANKILGQLAKQMAGTVALKKRKNLEKLNQRLARWIEDKLSSLRGLSETGEGQGTGKKIQKKRQKKEHKPPVKVAIHRKSLDICRGVSYELRALAFDEAGRPIPPGKVVWRSQNPSIVPVNPDSGIIQAKAVGLTTITVSTNGLTSEPALIQVHEAVEVGIKAGSPMRVGSNRRIQIMPLVKTAAGKVLKEVAVSWRSNYKQVATVGQDGWLVGGEVGEAEIWAYVGQLQSESLEVIVEKGAAGKPKGGGKGRPRILLSGHNNCPFDNVPVILEPTDPPIYQRPYKSDYENNVFWINLQHPLADELLKMGEKSIQWRTYHFQRLVDVYSVLEMRAKFADDQNLDIDQVLDEIHNTTAELYTKAKEEIFDILYNPDIDLAKLEVD